MKRSVFALVVVLLAGALEAAVFSGRITKVATRTFAVKRDGASKEFVLGEGTDIRIGSRKGRREDLRVGQQVTVVYEEQDGRPVAQRVEVTVHPKPDRPHAQD